MATIIWFTGLSGSGKTSLALELKIQLVKIGKSVEIIDGDEIRSTRHKKLGFSRDDIQKNNHLIAEICNSRKPSFDFILVPIISPYEEDRASARKIIGDDFVELYIQCPIESCIKRDVKGLYKKALSGEITNFIGIHESNPYQPPKNSEITINTENLNISESVSKVLETLHNLNKL